MSESTISNATLQKNSRPFKFLRIFTGNDAKSHFEVKEYAEPLAGDTALYRSQALEVEMLEFPPWFKMPYHLTDWTNKIPMTPDQSVMMIMLRGTCMLIADAQGTEPGKDYYAWGPGSVVLAEDLKGRGHAGAVLGDGATIICVWLSSKPITHPV